MLPKGWHFTKFQISLGFLAPYWHKFPSGDNLTLEWNLQTLFPYLVNQQRVDFIENFLDMIWFQIISGPFLLLLTYFCYRCVKLNTGVCMPYLWSWNLAESHVWMQIFWYTSQPATTFWDLNLWLAKNLIHLCNQIIFGVPTWSSILSNAI